MIKLSYSAGGGGVRDDHGTLQKFETLRLNVMIERLGVSLLNMEMKEIAYQNGDRGGLREGSASHQQFAIEISESSN